MEGGPRAYTVLDDRRVEGSKKDRGVMIETYHDDLEVRCFMNVVKSEASLQMNEEEIGGGEKRW